MTADEPDCGCAPTAAEMAVLRQPVSRRPFSRRTALGIGIGVAGLTALGLPTALSAAAAGYPSWDDVQRAKANEASKASEVARIEGLIQQLQADVAAKQAEAERLGNEYLVALEAYENAVLVAAQLQEQADAEEAKAAAAAAKLGKLAAQQYRSGGGDDAALELFFSGSAAGADDLLARLGTMDRLTEANRGVYNDAVSARDNARNLTNQAQVARDERDRLQREAEQKMLRAQEAAAAAQAALDAQAEHLDVLQAQLAALKDETATTVAQYQVGVEEARKAEEARRQREREEAEARAREEAAAGVGGGGSGSGGGWVRPASGWISSWYGNRGTICGSGGCTSGHRGLDFATGCSGRIYAAASGTVVFAAYTPSWGNYIKIDHGGGVVSAYAHIEHGGYAVGYGQWVSAGQVIAYAGNTGISQGCHLHFEIWLDGGRVDPAPFLSNRGVSV